MNNLLMKRELSGEQLSIIANEFDKKKKSKGVLYVLWLFFGSIGVHRFYLGDIGYGIGMIAVWIVSWFLAFVPILIWVLVDVFLIGKRLEKINDQLEFSIIENVKSYQN
ncbi:MULTISPECIES: TM2 domain-containing protein [Alteribacter]|uniref:TM2 domain-containing protein n=1 Tax=Alteribacter keqinensis TaxID=2483800 RepID=A0A3M7TUY4_9BACI|nr:MULTISPECIES: TM2 domain-containing protein [Alteribacter]MBM7097167.1 TM2 domain-containing protein [Alteribacter salitolerans]RNA68812.1 TM2 domain-containing protein [Alteribacter keqinensis]